MFHLPRNGFFCASPAAGTSTRTRRVQSRRSIDVSSEIELPGKLQEAREIVLGLRQLPERRAREARVRTRPDRVIERVEGFAAQLQPVALAEANRLLERHVQLGP